MGLCTSEGRHWNLCRVRGRKEYVEGGVGEELYVCVRARQRLER